MHLWTVVLKTVARMNSTGEFPYRVRALSEDQAVKEATELHLSKHPRSSANISVVEVVCWVPLG